MYLWKSLLQTGVARPGPQSRWQDGPAQSRPEEPAAALRQRRPCLPAQAHVFTKLPVKLESSLQIAVKPPHPRSAGGRSEAAAPHRPTRAPPAPSGGCASGQRLQAWPDETPAQADTGRQGGDSGAAAPQPGAHTRARTRSARAPRQCVRDGGGAAPGPAPPAAVPANGRAATGTTAPPEVPGRGRAPLGWHRRVRRGGAGRGGAGPRARRDLLAGE